MAFAAAISLSPEGGLKNAIVTLEGVNQGKPFDMSVPLIEARDCMFQTTGSPSSGTAVRWKS